MAEGPVASLLSAVVIGGTGAIGNCLVGALLKSKDSVGKIALLTRRKVTEVPAQYGVDVPAEEASGRLVQHVEDLDATSDDTVKQLCTGKHVFFSCLGTTRRQTGSKEVYRHIDMEIPLRIAGLAREMGVSHCSFVTSRGSSPNSWFFYFRMKGELEEAMRGIGFGYTSIFQPGFLDRRQGANSRFGESFALTFLSGIPVATVAQAMLQDALAHHSRAEEEASANVLIADNNRIRALYQESVPKEAVGSGDDQGGSST